MVGKINEIGLLHGHRHYLRVAALVVRLVAVRAMWCTLKSASEASACRLSVVSRSYHERSVGLRAMGMHRVRQLALRLHSFWQMPWWVCQCFQYMYIWAAPLGFREGGARRNALGTCWRRAE